MKRSSQLVRAIVPTLLIGSGITYAGYVWSGYQKGQKEYDVLNEAVLSAYSTQDTEDPAQILDGVNDQDIPVKTENEKISDEEAVRNEASAEKQMWKPLITELPADAPPRVKVDWEELLEKNGDVVGWISVPAVDISYPVLQSDDNEYYLHRDINQEYLFAGSIFMDAWNSPSMMGYNTIIYGHNMRDGSMFARLKEFQSTETYEKCRYFWLYTPDADLLYEICSIHSAQSGSDTFTLRFADYQTYRDWQEKMLEQSVVSTGIQLEYQDRIVTLSTCTQASAVRMTVQGKLIWKRNRA